MYRGILSLTATLEISLTAQLSADVDGMCITINALFFHKGLPYPMETDLVSLKTLQVDLKSSKRRLYHSFSKIKFSQSITLKYFCVVE